MISRKPSHTAACAAAIIAAGISNAAAHRCFPRLARPRARSVPAILQNYAAVRRSG